MSLSASYLPRYTPAQLAAKAALKEIEQRRASFVAERRKQEEAAREAAKQAAEERRREQIAQAEAEMRLHVAHRRLAILAERRATKTDRNYGGGIPKSQILATVKMVADAYEVEPEEILGWSRYRKVAVARVHFTAILAKNHPRLSIAGLGRLLGRDHTTILHQLWCYNSSTGENIRNVTMNRRPSVMKFIQLPNPDDPPLLALMEGRAPATPSSMIGCGA